MDYLIFLITLQVCQFLEGRCVDKSVVARFREQKMDGSAVIYCPEFFLMDLGLKTKGDLYALRLFCEREEKKGKNKDIEERKQYLIEKLRSTKESRHTASEGKKASSTSNAKSRYRKFEIGWLHFS